MNLTGTLDKALCFMECIDEKLDGISLKNGAERYKISAGLLHLSLEHFGSIVILVEKNLNGSASALIRLQYEALIRGVWYQYCASDVQVERFSAGKNPPDIKTMINSIEAKLEFKNKAFTYVHESSWVTMNGYTHGGIEQIQRRYSDTEIKSRFTDEERKDLVISSCAIALTATTHTSIMLGNIELAGEFINQFRKDFIEAK